MKTNEFKFFFQETEESKYHTQILREVWDMSKGDPASDYWVNRLLEVYFAHLLETNLPAAAEMFRAIDCIVANGRGKKCSPCRIGQLAPKDMHP